ncbi:hypothetical protein CVT24_001518 [Panaeolus cyanescens]|uniref:Uncharacterized protein n=1 Tax=Panaeolus cyanescens TaxID=181874 RepID=A0A409YFB0_9AGAR|nr:hypothetical protein CVT24_001518 [Panaeolus cyanescens]
MFSNQSGSRRWTHFHSALQLAIQRSAHKWTFEDFAECFPLYVEEDKNGASATFNAISDYIEAQNFRDLEKLFKDYNVQENIDILHKVVNDGKDRAASGNIGKDVWQDNLDPTVTVAARTIPVLAAEAEKLRQMIATYEQENRSLQEALNSKVKETERANQQGMEVLNKLDEVFAKWEQLPREDMEELMVQTLETLRPPPPM